MSSALDLVLRNGALKGLTVRLRPDVALLIGRSTRGLQLVDPLVNLSHAEITWQGDQYWIEDLGSTSGTFINQVRVTDRPVPIHVGEIIRVGDTEIEICERVQKTSWRVVGVFASVILVSIALITFVSSIQVQYRPQLAWFDPIASAPGVASKVIDIPVSFIREAGVDHRQLQLVRVTDYDHNGVSELWFSMPGASRVVTFDVEGGWKTLGDLPTDCHARARSASGAGVPADCLIDPRLLKGGASADCERSDGDSGFPDLECHGEIYRFLDGAYTRSALEGAYVWMPPVVLPKASDKPAPNSPKPMPMVTVGAPSPWLVQMAQVDELAGFLADRGVREPIHYLICEGVLPGIRAQVLTESGRLKALSRGCLGETSIEGVNPRDEFGDGRPQMLAFTGAGRIALLDDIATALSGGISRYFISRQDLETYDILAKTPLRRTGAYRTGFQGESRAFNPIASEAAIHGYRKLLRTAEAGPAPARVWQTRLDGPGQVVLSGCSTLSVESGPWNCLFAKGCRSTSTFMRLTNTGCGDGHTVQIPYGRGVYPYRDGAIEGWVAVDSIDEGSQVDVLRVKFDYREVGEP